MLHHTVKQGECLSSITAFYGFSDWHTIYDDPANAEFRTKRPDPNLIYPGDELCIPDRDPGEHDCATDARHVFSVKRHATYLNVRVQDFEDEPIRNARFELDLDTEKFEGTTDASGWIRMSIPALAEQGWLSVWPDPADENEVVRWRVQLGHLDPLDTISGIKARLRNLGYDCGEVNEQQDESYKAAVREFQKDYDLVVDGIVGPKTRAKLKELHHL